MLVSVVNSSCRREGSAKRTSGSPRGDKKEALSRPLVLLEKLCLKGALYSTCVTGVNAIRRIIRKPRTGQPAAQPGPTTPGSPLSPFWKSLNPLRRPQMQELRPLLSLTPRLCPPSIVRIMTSLLRETCTHRTHIRMSLAETVKSSMQTMRACGGLRIQPEARSLFLCGALCLGSRR